MATQYESMADRNVVNKALPARKATAKKAGVPSHPTASRNAYGDCCGDNSRNCDKNC